MLQDWIEPASVYGRTLYEVEVFFERRPQRNDDERPPIPPLRATSAGRGQLCTGTTLCNRAPARGGPVKRNETISPEKTRKRVRVRTSTRAPARAAGFVPYVAILAPFVAALLYVRAYGVDVFYADEWDLVPLLRESTRGTLGVADLLAHHNGHVYLFPWGITLLLGRVTGYDTVPLMYVAVFCLLATSLAVYYAYARSVGRSPLACLLFLPAPLLLFSFRQHENLLWGNQISFAFAQTFSVLALCLLFAADGRHGRLAFAALCAVVASCSAAPGLLVWPAGLALLLIRPADGRPVRRFHAGAWSLLGAVIWVTYFTVPGGSGPSPGLTPGEPASWAAYLLALSGGSLLWSGPAVLAAGALLILLAVAALALAFGRTGENAFWISLGTFSLLSLALIAAGRSGLEQEVFARAVASRYAAFSIPGVVALYCLLANLTLRAGSRVAAGLLALLAAAMLAGAAYSYPRGMEAGREVENSREQAARILLAHETESLAAFTIFGHDPGRVQGYARYLDRHNYGVFAAETSATDEGSRIHADR
jgi:hypothetical protein